jgi:hypothetical protein
MFRIEGALMRKVAFFLAVGLILGISGCGGGAGKVKLYSVSGKVTVGGKPLTDCTVQFVISDKAAAYTSKIGADGSYSLVASQDGRSGAEVGKYKVVLAMSAEMQAKAMMSGAQRGPLVPGQGQAESLPFPKEYSSLNTTPKEVDVEAKSNTIDIVIP